MIAPAGSTFSDLDECDRLYEEIDGQLVEAPPMSFFANWLATRLTAFLFNFADRNDLGFTAMECLFQLNDPVNRNRRPDVAFVSRRRWPKDKPIPRTSNALEVTPSLLVEFISPNDIVEEVMEKLEEYFVAGAEQVWLVYPTQSRIQIFDSPTSSRWLGREDVLESLPYLPGFQLPLRELFVETA